MDTTPKGRREQTDCESQHQVVSQTLADVRRERPGSPGQAASLPPMHPPQPRLGGAPRQHSSGRRATPAQRHIGALGSETRAHTPTCHLLLRHLGRFPRLSACWRGIIGIHNLSFSLKPPLRALPQPASAETRSPQEASTTFPRGPALCTATGVPSRSLASVTGDLGGVCCSVSVRAGTCPAHSAPWQGGAHISQAGLTTTVRPPQSCPLR